MDKESMRRLEKKSAPRIYGPDAFPFDLKNCPGYQGYIPENLTHEVCKWCGSIHYYH